MYVESGGDEGCERGEGVGEYDCYVSTLLKLCSVGMRGANDYCCSYAGIMVMLALVVS